MENVIAHKEILGVLEDGSKINIQFSIGTPYQLSSDEWACPIKLTGIYNISNAIHGIDSFQSLLLAIRLLHKLLSHFIEDGGLLYWPDSKKELSLNELFDKDK